MKSLLKTLLVSLLISVSCWASNPVLIGHSTAPSATTRTSAAITTSLNGGIVASGGAVVVFVTGRNNQGSASGSHGYGITDTDGNTWWPVGGQYADLCYAGTGGTVNFTCAANTEASDGSRANLAYICPNPKSSDTTDVITVSWTTAQAYSTGWAVQVPGTTADPWCGSANTFSISTGPLTTPAASCYQYAGSEVVLSIAASTATITSTPSGSTNLESATAGYSVDYKTGVNGNTTVAYNWSGSNFSICVEAITLRTAYPATSTAFLRDSGTSVGASNNITQRLNITGTPGGTTLVIYGSSAGTDTLSVSDSNGDTYTNLFAYQTTTCASAGFACIAAYSANIPAGVTWVQVAGTGGDNGAIGYAELANVATTSPLDKEADQSGTATSYTSQTVSTTAANEVLLGLFLAESASLSALAPSGSWTYPFQYPGYAGGNAAQAASQVVSSTQTNIANTGTVAGTTLSYRAAIATFKAASQLSGNVTPAHAGIF